MRLLEVISGRVVAPAGVQFVLTMSGVDSRQIRKVDGVDEVQLLSAWSKNQAIGIAQIYSPLMHDNQVAIRARSLVADVRPWYVPEHPQKVQPTDTLTMDLSGSAVGGDFEIMAALISYKGSVSMNSKFITAAQLRELAVHETSRETTHVSGAGGGYTGGVFLNSGAGVTKNDKYYALTGFKVNGLVTVVGYTSVDWGNVRLGGPGCPLHSEIASDWFVMLAKKYDDALIPVFAGVNIGSLGVDVAADENAGTFIVNTFLTELSGFPGV